jgi:hypothetical protein
MKKLKKLSVVVFQAPWGNNLEKNGKHPLKNGEKVLYLGEIPNCPGHCAVAKKDGAVIWLVHPEEFREAREDEL